MESTYQRRVSMSCNDPDSAKENKSNIYKSEISIYSKKLGIKLFQDSYSIFICINVSDSKMKN
jgi:hypothetical protein